MASFQSNPLLLFLLSLMAVVASASGSEFKLGEEKATRLHFYMHDILSGPNPTAIRVVQGPLNLTGFNFNFGDVFVMDDPLTKGPNSTSELIGRAQGFYVFASQDSADIALLLTTNLVFKEGKYNGSTLSILSRDAIFAPVRELPVVGGTGVFRLARGYALLKTFSFNTTSGDAVLELDVYVMHY
ncbi:pterocarpan synthase 1-like [Phoenix dactylifera]|uniref:Dirigent protein n=1 Tax=Phoenix dactylifera TaxID=42345 RepID=A0A8B7BEV2_PHODC|nr:pterocarpan synthase 1-like [Phoenix dactylifera]